jgi:hypothetical protein
LKETAPLTVLKLGCSAEPKKANNSNTQKPACNASSFSYGRHKLFVNFASSPLFQLPFAKQWKFFVRLIELLELLHLLNRKDRENKKAVS